MSRDYFREAVFKRDNHKCVICGHPAQDAHHIMERRLWPDGGYYLDNGASLCAEHHLEAEQTDITVEQIREYIGCKKVIPPHLYDDEVYDKWGNIILNNGKRIRGELFFDESVQKILSKKLHLFTNYVKYPRTYHLPWSENMNKDDRMIYIIDAFIGQEVVVTEKMDGENSTLYRDHVHARSVESKNHISRDWLKNYWSSIKEDIPEGWRICGENLWARHSIPYYSLQSYFLGFSVWNEKNECLSWDDTLEWFSMLGIISVPIIYIGIYDEKLIRGLYKEKDWKNKEGYVVRLADKFSYSSFKHNVGKFVRKNHIQTVKHWMHGLPIERNQLL